MAKKSAHGGEREGAGRPSTVEGTKRELYISDNLLRELKEHGEKNASKGLRVMRDLVVLFQLGFYFDEAKAIIETDDDTYELQCPKCHKYWAYFDKEYKRGICPNCGEIKNAR
jgi:ssDNA-binding Zn-finger/Zn-ribbon topoisomerase 1